MGIRGYVAGRRGHPAGEQMRLAVNGPRRAQGELTIGIVGPHELVERIMLSGTWASGKAGAGGPVAAAEGGPPRRLVAAAYRDEQEAADQVVRLGSAIDVCLFASRVPYEYARAAGVLTGPATYVPLGGGALYAAHGCSARRLPQARGRAARAGPRGGPGPAGHRPARIPAAVTRGNAAHRAQVPGPGGAAHSCGGQPDE